MAGPKTMHTNPLGGQKPLGGRRDPLARQFASLDQISGGRAGWNLVTSNNEAEAFNHGRDQHVAHADRYDRAGEFAEVVIGRASDFFGPGTVQSALGETVFATAQTGRSAQVMGDPHQPHSYSYTPDVAAALIALATRPRVSGQVWHLPVGETRSTRQIVEQVYALAGHRPRCLAAGRTMLRLIGLFKPAMREYQHTLYQFSERWVVDDTKFRAEFGDLATPLDEALAATLRWYGDRAAQSLSPATTH